MMIEDDTGSAERQRQRVHPGTTAHNVFSSAMFTFVLYLLCMLIAEVIYPAMALAFGSLVSTSVSTFSRGANSVLYTGLALIQPNRSRPAMTQYYDAVHSPTQPSAPHNPLYPSDILSDLISSIRELTNSNMDLSLKTATSNLRDALLIIKQQTSTMEGISNIQDKNFLHQSKKLALITKDIIADWGKVVHGCQDMLYDWHLPSIDRIVYRQFLDESEPRLAPFLNEMDEKLTSTEMRAMHVQGKCKTVHMLAEDLCALAKARIARYQWQVKEKGQMAKHLSTIALRSIAVGLVTFAAQRVLLAPAPPFGMALACISASSAGMWLIKKMHTMTRMAPYDEVDNDVKLLQSMRLDIVQVTENMVNFNTTLTRLRHQLKECGKRTRELKRQTVTLVTFKKRPPS